MRYNKFYGVGLYLLAVWMLYGRQEVLPRSVTKAFQRDDNNGLKEKKRDEKKAVDYYTDISSVKSGKSMYQMGEELKKAQKGK